MRVTRALIDQKSGAAADFVVDTDRLQLILHTGDPQVDLDETFSSLDALAAAYRDRVAPCLFRGDYLDTSDWLRFVPPDDLQAWLTELQACDPGPEPVGDTPLDTGVLRLAAVLRRKLNEGLGPDPVRLEGVVFYLGDFGLQGFYVNPPREPGADGWLGRDFRKTVYSLADNGLPGDAFSQYGDPGNLYDDVVDAALTLACAHIEAEPALRTNVEVSDPFRVYFVFHDMEDDVSEDDRRLARAHVGGPAAAWFEARRSSTF